MKIAVVIPYRNDRPLFAENLKRMIEAQTLQPAIIVWVDFEPRSESVDITARYREGYELASAADVNMVAFMEVDDWYSAEYLETMVKMIKSCENSEKYQLFGLNHTIYYHIREFKHFTMHHLTRSSAMNTLIRPNLNIKWGADHDPYTDVWLWNHLKGIVFAPEKEICLGIKHGIGLCGGQNHTSKMHRYVNNDEDKTFLREVLDEKSFDFYSNYFNQEV